MLVFKIHCSLTCFVNSQIKRDAIIKKETIVLWVLLDKVIPFDSNVIKIQNEVKRCYVWQDQGLRSVSAKIIEGLWYNYIYTALYMCWYKSTCPLVHFGERWGCGRWLCIDFKVNLWGVGFLLHNAKRYFRWHNDVNL